MTVHDKTSTIAAVATPPGRGGVGVVRISGPKVWSIADALFRGQRTPSGVGPGRFLFGRVVDGEGREIDTCLCLVFHAPASYTGEDTVELQGHGGPVVQQQILRRCLELGARPAGPGEFTRRAFLSGKIDLLQAEGVADLIHAQSERAAAAAVEQLEGSLSLRFNHLYDRVVAAAADVETTLDFVEEELPASVFESVGRQLDEALDDVRDLLSTWNEGRLLREGARAALIGRPNAGKSTLFNALLGQERAIVTEVPGTTRDVIEETLLIDGIPVRLLDTAGLRDTECRIEKEGIRRAREQGAGADLTLYLLDASVPSVEEETAVLSGLDPRRTIVICNKMDCRHSGFSMPGCAHEVIEAALVHGQGLDAIRGALAQRLAGPSGRDTTPHAVVSERHRSLLQAAEEELRRASERLGAEGESAAVPAAEHLRSALEALGQVTGREYHDELLDHVFSRFCIGK